MKKLLVYKAPRGREIIFDSYEDDRENGIYWVEICPACHNRYRGLLKRKGISKDPSGSGEAACSVKGCKNENACMYVDFDAGLVTEQE